MTTIIANISKAAATRVVNVGNVPTQVTDFNVAENYTGADGTRKTQFYRISIWRERGAKMAQYLTLGRPIQLVGRVRGRAYIDKNGTPQCQLEMANPQVTFVTANPTAAAADAPADVAEEDGLPFETEEA